LALSAVFPGAPQETEYEAVYAAVTATERGRWFLAEFANRNRQADADTVIAALARIEAAVSGGVTLEPGAIAVWRDLNGIAAAVAQIKAVIAGSKDNPAPDFAGAMERIHDIAFSLRERAVATELCDALDASLRDIASASSEAGLGNGTRAAALLNELAARVDALIKRALTGDAAGAAVQAPNADEDQLAVAATTTANDDERTLRSAQPVAALANSLADAAFAIAPRREALSLTPHDEAPPSEPEPEQHLNGGPRWHIEAPDFFFQSPAAAPAPQVAEAALDESAPHALLPPAQLQTAPQEDPADLFEPAMPVAEVLPAQEPLKATGMPKGTVIYPTSGGKLRAAPNDSFAALRGLSEDELNALFG
jgi:hypothetical protein